MRHAPKISSKYRGTIILDPRIVALLHKVRGKNSLNAMFAAGALRMAESPEGGRYESLSRLDEVHRKPDMKLSMNSAS